MGCALPYEMLCWVEPTGTHSQGSPGPRVRMDSSSSEGHQGCRGEKTDMGWAQYPPQVLMGWVGFSSCL